MAEGLMNRVKRLVSGSVNTLVDAVENSAPETVMKESIREIDSAVDEVRDQLGLSIANKHHANKRLMEASAKHEDLAEKLRLAVDTNRDDLAEAAISRQLDLEAQIPILEDALKDASSEEAELESYIAALTGRRREMEEDLQVYLASRSKENEAASSVAKGAKPDRRVENAETAFNRVLRGATGIPGTAKSDRDTSVKLAELEKVSRENRIKERLAAIKAIKSAN
jgi:phage shock protein A